MVKLSKYVHGFLCSSFTGNSSGLFVVVKLYILGLIRTWLKEGAKISNFLSFSIRSKLVFFKAEAITFFEAVFDKIVEFI